MADSPASHTEQRHHKGSENLRPWPKGQSGNPAGRKALPSFLSDYSDSSAAMVVAAATGEVVEGYEDNAAIVEMAAECDPKLRILAANTLLDRVCGKPKESIEVDATTRNIREVVLRVVPAPAAKPVLEAKPTPPKALR